MQGFRLAVDYGTSHTVGLLQWPDGRRRQLLFDGSPLLPSAVCTTDAAGTVAVGRDAERMARIDPARFEPNPKRHVDARELLLGEQVFPLVDVVAATLRRVHAEACRVGAQPPQEVVLTCPAGWGATRRAILTEAAARAGMPTPAVVTEPVAAATYFTAVTALDCPVGRSLVVYDLGAGTFDVSVVRRTTDGFVVLSVDGCDVGGLDFDAVVAGRVGTALAAKDPAAWQRLTAPATPADRRHFRTFWDDARGAKELLSRQASAPLFVPILDQDTVVTREEFDQAAAPLVSRTVELTAAAVAAARMSTVDIAGVFLVGGASRMPLVATMLHRRLGIAPTVLEQPEIVVAEGALLAAVPPPPREPTPAAPHQEPPAPAAPVSPPAAPPVPKPLASWPATAPIPVPTASDSAESRITPWSTRWRRRWGALLGGSGVLCELALISSWVQQRNLEVLLSLLLMLVVGVSFVRAGLRRPDTERRWVAGARWPLWGLVACFGFASVSGPLGGASGSDAADTFLATLFVTPVLLLLGVAAVWRRPSRGGATSFFRRAVAPGIIVVVSLTALPTLLFFVFYTVVQATMPEPRYADEAPVVVVALLAIAALFVASTMTLRNHVTRRPRLVIGEDGLEYAPDQHRALRLSWQQVARVEQQSQEGGKPPVLLVRLVPGTTLPQEAWITSLWRPESGAYAISDLKRLGVKPQQLAKALEQHAAGRLPAVGRHPVAV